MCLNFVVAIYGSYIRKLYTEAIYGSYIQQLYKNHVQKLRKKLRKKLRTENRKFVHK